MTPPEKDLKRTLKGGVFFDDITRHIYSFGASIYKIKPKGVILPRDIDDVIETVRYACSNSIPVIARGACTSLAGQAVGSGLILDFTKYMNRVISYEGNDTVVVQPGLVCGSLNRMLSSHKMLFPPDPSSCDYCTIGGMIAGNSGGPHSVKYGSTADWCEELRVVLSDGRVVNLKPGVRIKDISEPLLELFKENEDNIKKYAPKVRRTSSGYNVFAGFKEGQPDLVKLMSGSEGTLAVITEAKLRLAPLPESRVLLLFPLKAPEELADTIEMLKTAGPSAVEFMDEAFIRLAKEMEPGLKRLLPKGAKGLVLAELEGDYAEELDSRIARIKGSPIAARDPADRAGLWAVRRAAVPIMNRAKGNKRPVAFIEDAIVPPENLGEFMMGAYAIFEKYSVEACVYGHAGDGNMHIRPMLDLKDRADLIKMDNIADDFYRMVVSLNGSISAEHGDGILRIPYLKKQSGPLYAMFRGIKDIFDPRGILNPGKKIGQEERVAHDLVCDADVKYAVTGTVFDSESIRQEVEKCHACGLCRSVCPVNLVLPEEFASPRAKAAVIKGVITGELDAKLLRDPAIKPLLDTCINCKSCRVECPTGADVSQICSMAKEIFAKEWGVGFSQALLEKVRIAAVFPGMYQLLRSSAGKILAGLFTGIDGRRTLPKLSGKPLSVKRSPLAHPKKKVVYFSGCYIDLFNPEGEGTATINVLGKNKIETILPSLKCCGMPGISSGNVEGAHREIAFNVKKLYGLVRSGYDIVTSCPSCGLALKEEYPGILNTTEAMLVSQKTFDIHEYLWMLLNDGEMNTNFKPSSRCVVFHVPCHLKTQGIGVLQESLVQLIPGMTIKKMEDSCCGMAGTFGLKKGNFDLSASIGKELFSRIKSSGADYVVTGCGSCKMQINQFTSAKVIHTVELLSEYYL